MECVKCAARQDSFRFVLSLKYFCLTPSYPSIHLFIHLFSVATYLALKVTEVAAAEPSCHVAKDGVHLRQLACSLHPNVCVFGTWEVSQIKKKQKKHTGTERKLK